MVSESSEIAQFWVAIATNCQALTCCMKVSYVLSHERAHSLLSLITNAVLWNMIARNKYDSCIQTFSYSLNIHDSHQTLLLKASKIC
jgi:hypothetical protein